MKKLFKNILLILIILATCLGFFKNGFNENNTKAVTTKFATLEANGSPSFTISLGLNGSTGFPTRYKIWLFDASYTLATTGTSLSADDYDSANLLYIVTQEDCDIINTYEKDGYITLRPQCLINTIGQEYALTDNTLLGAYTVVFTYDTDDLCINNFTNLGKIYYKTFELSDGSKKNVFIKDSLIMNTNYIDFEFFAPLNSISTTEDSILVEESGRIIDADTFKTETTLKVNLKHFKTYFKMDGSPNSTLGSMDDVNYAVPAISETLKNIYLNDKTKIFNGLYTYTYENNEVTYGEMVYDKDFNYCYNGRIPSYFGVYPKYTDGTYSIAFNGNDETNGTMKTIEDLKIHDTTTFNLNYNNYYKIGYNFVGWSTTLNGEVVYNDHDVFDPSDFAKEIGSIITLYAVWTPKIYTVTVDLNNDTNQKYTYQLAYTSPFIATVPDSYLVRDCYLPDGFEDTLPETMPNNDVTIKLKWKPKEYKIKFYYEEDCLELYREIMYPYGTTIDTSSIVNPSKEGYLFVQWSTTMPETMPNYEIKSYAIWEPGSYELTYYPGKDLPDEKYLVRYGDALPLPPEYNIIPGYQFNSWDQEIPEIMPAKNLFISGVWDDLYFNITFIQEGGLEDIVMQVRYADSLANIKPNDPIRTNYEFTGWIEELPETMPATDLYIHASWELKHYTILFVDVQNGKDLYYTVEAGQEIVVPQTYKEYHKFLGWDKEILEIAPEYDLQYKALWEVNQYTVYFDTDGGSSITPISIAYGAPMNINVTTQKDGYEFVSWDTQLPITMPASDITLKAIWAKRPYTITYYNEEEVFFIDSYSFGEKVNTFSYVPEKVGYRFVRWNGTIPTVMDNADHKIYAEFKMIQYKVNFDSNCSIQYTPQTINYGETVQKVEDPTKVDYKFEGWYIDYALSTKYDFNLQVYSNITLYAKFTAIEKVSELNDKINNFDVTISLDKSIDALTTLETIFVTNENMESYNIDEIFVLDYARYLSEDIAIGALYKVNLKYEDKVVNYENMKISLDTPDIIRGKTIYVYHIYGDTAEEIIEYEWYDGKISITCNQLDEFAIFYEIVHEQVTPDTTMNILLYTSIAVGAAVLIAGGIFLTTLILKVQRRRRNSWIDDI